MKTGVPYYEESERDSMESTDLVYRGRAKGCGSCSMSKIANSAI